MTECQSSTLPGRRAEQGGPDKFRVLDVEDDFSEVYGGQAAKGALRGRDARGESMLREVKMGKRSDGLNGDEEMDGLSRESEAVMTRSRTWLSEWVGKVTCCVRFMEDRRE